MKNLITKLLILIILSLNISIKPYNETDIKKLEDGVQDLSDCDFSNANLSGKDLSYRDLSNADFERATLRKTIFQGAKLTKANFKRSVLKEANLEDVIAIKTNFLGSDMRKASCTRSSFVGATFGDRTIHNWLCADLRQADIQGSFFIKTNLDKVDLRGVLVDNETDFSGSSMFLIQVNREIFDIVKFENASIIEKPDDIETEKLITKFSELKLKSFRFNHPKKPEKVFVNSECPICLETFSESIEVARVPCGHVFHVECLILCLERKSECPLCRFMTNKFERININDVDN